MTYIYLALSPKDADLLNSHIRDKRTSCNVTADKPEITSYEIHGSHAGFIAFILQLIRAGKPQQMPQS